jgi:hypothetical protein
MKYGLAMAKSEKDFLEKEFFNEFFTEGGNLSTEEGNIEELKALKDKPGSKEVTFEFDFPKGKEKGSGTITRYKDGRIDASYEGSVIEGEERFEWQSIETGKVKDGVFKGLEIVTFPHSPKKSSFIMETQMDLAKGTFTNKAYQWK